MQTASDAPALAAAADLLGGQLQAHLQHFSDLVEPHAGSLERRFLSRLKRRGVDPRQRRALAGITPGAAASILGRGRPPSDFFEQVEYCGRRLAKLNLAPSAVTEALREYDELLGPLISRLPSAEKSNLIWALEQLHFCITLTLNNAFYQVREAETRTYTELFSAELESNGLEELLPRLLGVLAGYCQADAALLYLLDDDGAAWQLKASSGRLKAKKPPASVAATPRGMERLSTPHGIKAGSRGESMLLHPGWRGNYASWWSVPLALRGRLKGVLQFAFARPYEWLPRELEMLTAAGELCLLAGEKARLVRDLTAREDQLQQLAEHLLLVEEIERRRISGELHDEAGQSLLCIRLRLELLERAVPESLPALSAGLREVREMAESAIVEIRRLIGDLSPAVLEQLGLAAALRQLVHRFRRLSPARVHLRLDPLPELPRNVEKAAYRLAQECFNNIAKHSSATRVNISVLSSDGTLRLTVEDDGVGFQVNEVLAKRDSYGLAGMRERVTLLGGKLDVVSRPKEGTRISIRLPLRSRVSEQR